MNKEEQRLEIQALLEQFVARGGMIQQIPPMHKSLRRSIENEDKEYYEYRLMNELRERIGQGSFRRKPKREE